MDCHSNHGSEIRWSLRAPGIRLVSLSISALSMIFMLSFQRSHNACLHPSIRLSVRPSVTVYHCMCLHLRVRVRFRAWVRACVGARLCVSQLVCSFGVSATGSTKTVSTIDVHIDDVGSILNFSICFSL